MVKEALLRQIEGLDGGESHWTRGRWYETNLPSLAHWMESATRRGFLVTPAPDLDGLVLSQDGGTPYRIADPRAVPGRDLCCVLVWEG